MRIMAKKDLRKFILLKGYTVTAFAEKVGLSRRSVHAILGREHAASPVTSQKILKATGADFDDVFEIVETEDKLWVIWLICSKIINLAISIKR